MLHSKVYWSTCIFLTTLFASIAGATTIVLPTDEQLIAKSPLIIEGTVVRSAPVEREHGIWTETTVAVANVIKGELPVTGSQFPETTGNRQLVTIREIGGIVDDRITKIFGAPEYRAGEHVLLFLNPTPRGDYQTVDLYVGKFAEETTLGGERLWARHDDAGDVTLLDRDFNPIAPSKVQRDAVNFEQYIVDRAAGRPGIRNYEVFNPVVIANAKSTRIAPDFTVISEPSIYRWFAFETGQSAKWYSNGAQPGYSGGGVNEIQTAMGAWNNYSAALIRYAYSGTTTTLGGNRSRNGINEILFSDPNGEIAGSFNPSTGGVVGQGGFNGVSGSDTWNAPFTADATHTQRPYTAWNITEGNLVIQDNVSPQTGMSSAVLAEIVAHEFGHTLGFGHSTDNTALMFPTITRLGPSLRGDDQVAARWLYPNGGAVPPPPVVTIPAAPSGVTASVSGTNITLRWNDNANNETGQSVYMAIGNGAFNKTSDLGAGQTSLTFTGFAAGSYRFYVVATNSAGTSAQSNVASATVGTTQPSLVAAFSWSPASPATNQVITFFDQSAGSPTAWQWSFADGTTSTAQNPAKQFPTAGTYSATLTVSRNGASSTVTHTFIVVNGSPATPPVTAAFGFNPGTPSTGQNVSFTDQSTGSPTSWQWSFGDGLTSSLQNPTHVYALPGTYTVTLTATNAVSSSSSTRGVTVVSSAVPYRALVSVITQATGVGGATWRTELTIFNAGNDAVTPQLIFFPGAGGQVRTRSIYLAPKQSLTYANALLEIFGLLNSAGALGIEADGVTSSPDLRVSSRTFTDGSGGSYGQSVNGVMSDELPTSVYLTGLESDNAFRTNIGLVNRSSAQVGVTLELLDANGTRVGINFVTLAANNFQQSALSTLFPNIAGAQFPVLSMRVTAGSANVVSAYASIVDNRSQDPVYVQGGGTPVGGRVVIPAVGRSAGANNTFWRSDVTLFNPGTSSMSLAVRYLPAGSDNRSVAPVTVTVGAGRTTVLADVLSWLGRQSGSGALDIRWSGAAGPVVTSRTYTTTSNGGTFGQSIDPVSEFSNDAYVPGLRSDFTYRSNVGFVNGGDATIGVTTQLLGSNGEVLAQGFVALPPRSQTQVALSSMFPSVNAQFLGSVTLKAHADGAPNLFAYGSIIDNVSGDPVFFGGR